MDKEGAGILKDEMRRHGAKPKKSIKKAEMMDFLEGKRVLMPQPVAPEQHQRAASVAPALPVFRLLRQRRPVFRLLRQRRLCRVPQT